MQGNPVNIDGDQLTKWIFGLAQIFGHWPYTNRISSQNQLDEIEFTIRDRLRLTFNLLSHLLSVWFQFPLYYTTFSSHSWLMMLIEILIVVFYIMCSVSGLLITIYYRRNLLKILKINQEFDRQVSISNAIESRTGFFI